MKFLADECFSAQVVVGLRQVGYDVVAIRECAAGSDDLTVLGMAATDGRILLTEDKDFGELVVRQGRSTSGVIFLRMDVSAAAVKLSRLLAVLAGRADRLAGRFTVVDAKKVRSRPLV